MAVRKVTKEKGPKVFDFDFKKQANGEISSIRNVAPSIKVATAMALRQFWGGLSASGRLEVLKEGLAISVKIQEPCAPQKEATKRFPPR